MAERASERTTERGRKRMDVCAVCAHVSKYIRPFWAYGSAIVRWHKMVLNVWPNSQPHKMGNCVFPFSPVHTTKSRHFFPKMHHQSVHTHTHAHKSFRIFSPRLRYFKWINAGIWISIVIAIGDDSSHWLSIEKSIGFQFVKGGGFLVPKKSAHSRTPENQVNRIKCGSLKTASLFLFGFNTI